jgi:hypothetical protein
MLSPFLPAPGAQVATPGSGYDRASAIKLRAAAFAASGAAARGRQSMSRIDAAGVRVSAPVRTLAGLVCGARLVEIGPAGHLRDQEQPAAFAVLIGCLAAFGRPR